MTTETEVQEIFVGKTIVSVESYKNYDDQISCMCIHFDDGTKIDISSSSYNYGPQNLVFDK